MRRFATWLLSIPVLLVAAFICNSAQLNAQTKYSIDDGTAESAMGYGLPADFVWVTRFQSIAPADTITSVDMMFSDVPNGTPVTVGIWEDFFEYGDANTALLVAKTTGVVNNSGMNVWNNFVLPPTKVSGIYFVGAYITLDAQYPAMLDKNTATQGRCWFGSTGPGMLNSNTLPVMYHLETIGVKGVFMIRANGTGSEFPGVLAYGTGTPGCDGASKLTANSAPRIGSTTFGVKCDKTPSLSLGMCMITDAQDYVGSDPFGIGVLLHVDLLAATQVIAVDVNSGAHGISMTILPVPNVPSLVGQKFYAQILWLWPSTVCTLPPLNLSTSTALELTIQS